MVAPSAPPLLLLLLGACRLGGGAAALSLDSVPAASYRKLGDMEISPLLTGMWQVSGSHGYRPDPSAAVAEMGLYTRAGFNTFDLADHYGDAEDYVGAFAGSAAARDSPVPLHYLTKWVPRPEAMTGAGVRAAMEISQSRMKTQQLDMLQFHCEQPPTAPRDCQLLLLLAVQQHLPAAWLLVMRPLLPCTATQGGTTVTRATRTRCGCWRTCGLQTARSCWCATSP